MGSLLSRDSVSQDSTPQKSRKPSVLPMKRMEQKCFEKLKKAYEGEQEEEFQLEENAKISTDSGRLLELYFRKYHNNPTPPKPRVKLMITALSFKSAQSGLRNTAGRVFRITPFGSVHTILQIDGTLIEWNNSSLVTIWNAEEFTHNKAMVSLDLEFINDENATVEGIRKVCQTIATWNGCHEYSAVSHNCQQFTNELLKDLGIQIDEESKMFLKGIHEIGDPELPVFKWTLKNGEKLKIASHEALDEHAFKLEGMIPPTSLDYRVLKAIDRMFWIRFYSALEWETENDEQKTKRESILERCCPCEGKCFFLNPAETGTLIGANLKEEANEYLASKK